MSAKSTTTERFVTDQFIIDQFVERNLIPAEKRNIFPDAATLQAAYRACSDNIGGNIVASSLEDGDLETGPSWKDADQLYILADRILPATEQEEAVHSIRHSPYGYKRALELLIEYEKTGKDVTLKAPRGKLLSVTIGQVVEFLPEEIKAHFPRRAAKYTNPQAG